MNEIALQIAGILQRDIRELELLPVDAIELEKKITEIEHGIPEPEMRPVR